MFISPAFAETPRASGGLGGLEALLPLLLIFVVFYFLLIRPQQKKMKQHRDMLAAIRRGDKVVTGGGIIGTVAKVVSDTELSLEIAEGVRVRVQRALISGVLTKPEPAKSEAKSEKAEKAEAKSEAKDVPDDDTDEGDKSAKPDGTPRG